MSRSLSEDCWSSPRRRSISDSASRSVLLSFSLAAIWASSSFSWVGSLVRSGGGVYFCALIILRSSFVMCLWAFWSSTWVCPSLFSWIFRCATLISCVARNSMSLYAFPACSSATNLWAASRMIGSFRSSFPFRLFGPPFLFVGPSSCPMWWPALSLRGRLFPLLCLYPRFPLFLWMRLLPGRAHLSYPGVVSLVGGFLGGALLPDRRPARCV